MRFRFRMIRRIMQISEAVIHLGRTPSTIYIIDLIQDARHLCTRLVVSQGAHK